MKDDLSLSLLLDGRLPPEEAARLEQRIAADPRLRGRWEAMRRLHAASRQLAFTAGDFTTADVLARAEAGPGRFRRLAPWAAAALLLAVTHGGAYLFGVFRRPEPAPSREATRDFLERAARIDPALPPDRLRSDLRRIRQELPARIARGESVDALSRMEVAFDAVEDPGFLGIVLSGIARESLDGDLSIRFVPTSARRYARILPAGGDRLRLLLVDASGERPTLVTDEGTRAELRVRHPGLVFHEGE